MTGSTGYRAFTAALLFGVAAIPGLAMAESVTIEHAKGEITFDETPQKVAVFDLASLDTLNALGVDVVAGVPKGEDGSINVPGYLQGFGDAKYVGIGTLFEPDIEALKELAPDLIIIAGRSASKYDDVRAIAPTIDMSAQGDNLVASGIKSAETLGKLFGVEDKAAEKIAELEAAVTGMHQAAGDDDKALVLFAVANNMMAHAPGARFGTLYDFVGLQSVMAPAEPAAPGPRPEPGSPEAEEARKRQQEARDAALAADPDWIITLDRGSISSSEPSDIADRLAADEKVTATTAWQQEQVIHLDPRAWYLVGTGIQNLTDTANAIAAEFREKE